MLTGSRTWQHNVQVGWTIRNIFQENWWVWAFRAPAHTRNGLHSKTLDSLHWGPGQWPSVIKFRPCSAAEEVPFMISCMIEHAAGTSCQEMTHNINEQEPTGGSFPKYTKSVFPLRHVNGKGGPRTTRQVNGVGVTQTTSKFWCQGLSFTYLFLKCHYNLIYPPHETCNKIKVGWISRLILVRPWMATQRQWRVTNR